MGDDLGIGLAGEVEPLDFQLAPQGRVILDHAVMHHRDARSPVAAAEVRVGIAVARRSVRRPAGVADPAVAPRWLDIERFFQDSYPPGALTHHQAVAVEGSEPG